MCVCAHTRRISPQMIHDSIQNYTPENFQFLLFFLYSFFPIEFFTLKQLLSVLLFLVYYLLTISTHTRKKYYKGREHCQFCSLICLSELKPVETMPNSWWMLNNYFLRLCSSKMMHRTKIMIIISMTKNNCPHHLHV